MVGVPLADFGGVGVVLQPGFGAADNVPERGGVGGEGQFGAALFVAYPVDGYFRVAVEYLLHVVLLEVGEAVDYGKEFAYVVCPQGCDEVEELLACGDVDPLVFHRPGIAAAGSVDRDTVQLGTWHTARAHNGHAVFVYPHHRRLGGRGGVGFLYFVVGTLVGIAGGFEGVEGFVLRGTDTGDLLLTVGPVVVDAGRITLPNNVVFLFLCHRIEVQRYKLFLIYGFLFVSLHFKRILKTVYNEENHFYATCAVRFVHCM